VVNPYVGSFKVHANEEAAKRAWCNCKQFLLVTKNQRIQAPETKNPSLVLNHLTRKKIKNKSFWNPE
jgi:hypothetical protein